MINKVLLIVYIFFVLIISFVAYNNYTKKETFSSKKSILSLNENDFKRFKEAFDTNQTFGYLWGLKNKTVKVKMKKKIEKTIELLPVKQTKFTLCIKEDCFRFLGLYKKKDKLYVSLYNKNFKHGIENFTYNDNIAYTLYLKAIYKNSAIFADRNSSREWEFKLFDVNTTKYKPKDINETNL